MRWTWASVAAALLVWLTVFSFVFGEENNVNAQPQAAVKRPSAASQPYVVTTAAALDAVVKDLHGANKRQNLMVADNVGCQVFVQHEKDVTTNQAEVHDAADDIFVILDGTADFVLGGELDSPRETGPGEWRSSGISGGKEIKANKGDMIMVPRGTPHRRITAGQDATVLIIKASAPKK
jgi:mannose-6-phosphate isomerase-like protein (cupin superfamily)